MRSAIITIILTLLSFFIGQTRLQAQSTCDEITFDIVRDCDIINGVTFIISPSDMEIPFTYISAIDTISNHTGVLFRSYENLYSFMGDIDIYVDNELCSSVDATTICFLPDNGETCNTIEQDFNIELLPIACNADSSFYAAQLVVSGISSAIETIEYGLTDGSWYSVFSDKIVEEGDTITIDNITVGNPVYMNFYYLKNGELTNCSFEVYPENPCYESLCDVISISEMTILENTIFAPNIPNILLPYGTFYFYVNDSLYYEGNTYNNISYSFFFEDDIFPVTHETMPYSIAIEAADTIEALLVLEFEECTYTYSESLYQEIQNPVNCDDFDAVYDLDCIDDDNYEVTIGVTGFDSNSGYYINGTLSTEEVFSSGLINTEMGFFYEIVLASDPSCSITFSGNGITCNPLAIELIDFSGKYLEIGNEISWLTASEYNSEYFTLEHSTDGIHFETVAQIASQNNSANTNRYEYLHEEVSNRKHYYRLLETDSDGKTLLVSEVIEVERDGNESVVIFPNPTTEWLFIETALPLSASANIQLFDIQGKQVLSRELQETVSVNVGGLVKGVYLLQIENEKAVIYSQKIIVR